MLENKKFDYRCFVAIPSSKPFIAYFMHGFIRRSVFDYYSNKDSIEEANQKESNL